MNSGLTVLTLDRWMALDVVRSRSGSIYRRHTEMYTDRLNRHTGKLWERWGASIASSAPNQSKPSAIRTGVTK
jgi:hypothetical protein